MRKTVGGKRLPISVVGSSTFGRYEKVSPTKTYNMYMTKGGSNEDDFWLVNTPGYKRVYDVLPSGVGRGIFTSIRGNILIVVVNNSVYSFDTNLNPTFIGNLATSVGEVFIDENLANQICIVDGVNIYIYNHTLPPNLTIQGPLGNLVPNYVAYHNSFFLFGNGDTTSNGQLWYVYESTTATTISPITNQNGIFSLQTKPDFAKAVLRLPGQGNNILVLGTSVGEIWTQVPGQIYRRNSTINVDYGVVSVSTIASSDNYVAWIAINQDNAPVVMVYSGQGAKRISSYGIDYQMGQIKFPDQSTATFNRIDGHLCYQFTFYNPADNLTLFFDFTTERFFHLSDEHLNYHPARDYAYFNHKTYFVSLRNASLYETSTNLTSYDENVAPLSPDPLLIHEIQRVRICDTINSDDSSQYRANTFVFTIEQGNDARASIIENLDLLITEDIFAPPDDIIYTEFGVPIADEDSGLGIGLGNSPIPYRPRVDMSVSRDSGISWSNIVARELNPVAIRQNILNWENMGMANSLTIKLRFWGLDRFVCYNGFIEIF